jgi:hypothetical protein
MQELLQAERDKKRNGEVQLDGMEVLELDEVEIDEFEDLTESAPDEIAGIEMQAIKRELMDIRELLLAPA